MKPAEINKILAEEESCYGCDYTTVYRHLQRVEELVYGDKWEWMVDRLNSSRSVDFRDRSYCSSQAYRCLLIRM